MNGATHLLSAFKHMCRSPLAFAKQHPPTHSLTHETHTPPCNVHTPPDRLTGTNQLRVMGCSEQRLTD